MVDSPENTGQIQDGRFKAGQSGNPSGKPKGARNKTTLAMQELLDGEAEAITRKAIELAKSGDITAIRLVLERVLPPRKDSPIQIELGNLESFAEVVAAMRNIFGQIGSGEITLGEGRELLALLHNFMEYISLEAARISAWELQEELKKLR